MTIKYYYARTSQNIVQMLPFPTTNKPNVHVIRRFHKHLHDGTIMCVVLNVICGVIDYFALYHIGCTTRQNMIYNL
jgi:hypothetical protein